MAGQPTQTRSLEAALFASADRLRGSLDAAAYKHCVLGLVFLRHVDEAARQGVLTVPDEASWRSLARAAHDPSLEGSLEPRVDRAMALLEQTNPRLRGALPHGYTAMGLTPFAASGLVRLLDQVAPSAGGPVWRDALGRVYELFLGRFARAEGRNGGQYYTPRSLVRLLVSLLAPSRGVVYDPCCGSGGMFVQTDAFSGGQVRVVGQESNRATFRLARMNLALHGVDGDLGQRHADSLHDDLHPGLEADVVLANPPFNDRAWGGERLEGDARFVFGHPPPRNANFAWLQHCLAHLAPGGRAAVVMANGSLSSTQAAEVSIRRAMVEAGVVDAVIALPAQLFHSTPIPACVWVLKRPERGPGKAGAKTLFVDARALGEMHDRIHRVLGEGDIDLIAGAFRAHVSGKNHRDRPGFSRRAPGPEIASQSFVLTPGLYVGAAPRPGPSRGEQASEPGPAGEAIEGAGESAAAGWAELEGLLDQAARLDAEIRAKLGGER